MELNHYALEKPNTPMVQSPCTNLDNEIAQTQVSSTNNTTLTLTIKQAAELLQISPPIMYELAEQQDFPSFRIGKKIYISRKGLDEWIESRWRNKEVS